MRSLPVDVFLGAHGSFYNLTEKYARLEKGGVRIPSSILTVSRQYVDRQREELPGAARRNRRRLPAK